MWRRCGGGEDGGGGGDGGGSSLRNIPIFSYRP